MKVKNSLFFLFSWLVIHSITAQHSLTLLTQKKQFVAGSGILLEFKADHTKDYQLYCTNSYGSTLITSEIKNSKILFKIPSHISNKKGILIWKVINTTPPLSGKFQIISKERPTSLETYLGPPSIAAGNTDFAMLVVIVTDDLDNPLKMNTEVVIKHQFLVSEKKDIAFTNNLIAYQNIFSPLKSGRMILSSASLGLNSKEYDVNVLPAIGINFTIFSKRNHEYADGNQITTFYTSIIKDKNSNVVSDGTFVDFFITNKKGNILKTSGTTINGVAYAKMIHPEWQENWKIKGYIIGISESNSLEINYKQVIEKFDVVFSSNNRTLTIGPLISFMNQMIPDGLQVKLSIFKEGKLMNDVIENSKDGFVVFNLNSNIYENGNYVLKVATAGITKTFRTIKLW
ncbi:MAG: hypothetical protein ACJA1B_001619 [Polaribacter sp.]|jgi:hypothetical protein